MTIFPFRTFGLDFVSTASGDDLERQPAVVFAAPTDAIADFVAGQTLAAISRWR